MTYETKKPLPVKIPGTDILVEASLDENLGWGFIQGNRKSFLHILYEDSLNPNSLPILESDLIHRLWDSFRILYEDGEDSIPFGHDGRKQRIRHFYSEEAKTLGAEVGDLEPTLQQLHQEMRSHDLFMDSLVVFRNDKGLVTNLDNVQLPKTIHPVSVYTTKPVSIDKRYGISLKEFQEAGGHIIPHGIYGVPEMFTYDLEEFDDIEVVKWMLGNCEVDGSSSTYYVTSINIGYPEIGVLRGRKLTHLEKKS